MKLIKNFSYQKILSGSLQSLLASKSPELLMKAKSEVSLVCTASQSLSIELCTNNNNNHHKAIDTESSTCTLPAAAVATGTGTGGLVRAKSLEADLPACGAMWSAFVKEIVLNKGEKGLGFSILDYQVTIH